MIEEQQNMQQGAADRQADNDLRPSLSLQDIINMILDKWYWFVISAAICLGIAVYYIASTPKVYRRQATILIKDSRKGGGNDISAFSDLVGMSSRRSVDNELYVLQSRRLMTEVVRRLGLTSQYTVKQGLRTVDLYRRTPVEASVVDNYTGSSFMFSVTVGCDDMLTLTGFESKGLSKYDRNYEVRGAFGDTLATPVGKIVIQKTHYFSPEDVKREISVIKRTENATVARYRNATESNVANKQSSIIMLTIRDEVPQRAEDILNTLIKVYNDDAVEDKQRISAVTAEFIDERLEIIGSELGAVDRDIETFKRENRLFDVESEASRIMSESSKYKTEGLTIDNQIRIARFVNDYLQQEDTRSSLIPTTSAFSSGAINQQIDAYNAAVLHREKLLANSSENNPVIKTIDRDIAAMRNAVLASLDSHIASLEIQLEGVRREERMANMRISAAPSQEKEYLTIARQQRIKEELYLYLLNKREENALTIAITEQNARIVDSAFGSSAPVYPNKLIVLLIALAAGVIIPFAIIYLKFMLNTAVKGHKDIERYLNVPFLGDIPLCDNVPRNSAVVRENSRDSVSEAFRILRTNMSFMKIGKSGSRIIQVTSSNPHSGKTFISTNLAMTLAMSGRKVLLVDLDLRRRTLTKQFGHRSDPDGLSAYMAGTVDDVDRLIAKSGLHDNLDMIFAGLQPPNPAEMLMSETLDALFETLKARYEYILVDSVPAMAVADAVITNRLADICIYVVREGLLDRRQLPDIENMYRQHKLQNMCIVLNGATMAKRGYGYGYGYGYGGYGYGYGVDDSEEEDYAPVSRGVWGTIKSTIARRTRRRAAKHNNKR